MPRGSVRLVALEAELDAVMLDRNRRTTRLLATRLLALVASSIILVLLVRNSGVHINITVTIPEPSLQAATPQEEPPMPPEPAPAPPPPPPPPSIRARGRSDAHLANESAPGYCALMGPEHGSCERDDQGSWADVSDGVECTQRCATCERCRYVSFLAAGSLNHSRSTAHPRSGRAPFYWQCRWYSRCDLADLRRAPSPLEYRTVRVSAARVGTSSVRDAGGAPLRLAIATLFELKGGVNPDWECCFVQWCENAARLQALLPASWTSDQLVLSSDASMADRLAASSGCTRLRVVVVSEELRAAAAAFAARNARIDNQSGATKPTFYNPAKMHKWQAVSLAAYDVVIFADADLELVPVADTVPALAREAWRRTILALHASPTMLVCNPDPRSPLNGGLMLLKPSAAVYAEGVRALQTARFDPVAGWGDDARGAAAVRPYRLGAPAAERAPSAFPRRKARSAASRRKQFAPHGSWGPDSPWAFTGAGSSDQGLLFYVYFARRLRGAYGGVANKSASLRLPYTRHWWAGFKPWLEFRERLQYARSSKRWLGWHPKKNDGENSLHLAQFYDYVVREHAEPGDAPSEAAARPPRCVELQRRLRREIEAYSRFPQIYADWEKHQWAGGYAHYQELPGIPTRTS